MKKKIGNRPENKKEKLKGPTTFLLCIYVSFFGIRKPLLRPGLSRAMVVIVRMRTTYEPAKLRRKRTRMPQGGTVIVLISTCSHTAPEHRSVRSA
jgi:hypothetical protein